MGHEKVRCGGVAGISGGGIVYRITCAGDSRS